MPPTAPKCIILLSNKSSGSTAFQEILSKYTPIQHVEKSRHFANETLYWTKAASILGMPQINMLDSEVPISPRKAKSDLITLLQDNLKSFEPPDDSKELIFEGWRLLCEKYSPVFLEKSPHHLPQWPALSLIIECINRFPEIEFLIVGLVRNPMDVLFSAYKRWRTNPEKYQWEWFTAHNNFLKIKKQLGDKLITIRYEDMISSVQSLNPVLKFAGADISSIDNKFFHSKSITRWKKDKHYGFNLSPEVFKLAEQFGYREEELINSGNFLWPVSRIIVRYIYKIKRTVLILAKNLK